MHDTTVFHVRLPDSHIAALKEYGNASAYVRALIALALREDWTVTLDGTVLDADLNPVSGSDLHVERLVL